ncbi:MAG: hypothetical protein FWF43_05745 [Propionibacteriaceae bacterium]|nr:hypothetical protein [Propionibacteriaceae bacterium]
MGWQDVTVVRHTSRWVGLIAIEAVLVACALMVVLSYLPGGRMVGLGIVEKGLSLVVYTAIPMVGAILVASESLSWGGSGRVRPRQSRSARTTRAMMMKAAVKTVLTRMRLGKSQFVPRLPTHVFSLAGGAFALLVLVGILQNMGTGAAGPSWLPAVVEELAEVAYLVIAALGSTLLGIGIVLMFVTKAPFRWRPMTALAGVALMSVSLGFWALRLGSTSGASSVWPQWATHLEGSFEIVTMLAGIVLIGSLVAARPLLRRFGAMSSSR